MTTTRSGSGRSVRTTSSWLTLRTRSAASSTRCDSRISPPAGPCQTRWITSSRHSPGPPTVVRFSMSKRTRSRCSACACASTSSAPIRKPIPGLRAGRPQLLHDGRTRPGTTATSSSTREHRLVRDALRRRRGPEAGLSRLPAQGAGPRVPGCAPRRTLDHPHQLAGEELPPDGGQGRRRERSVEVA